MLKLRPGGATVKQKEGELGEEKKEKQSFLEKDFVIKEKEKKKKGILCSLFFL